jgi:hypothetical protein
LHPIPEIQALWRGMTTEEEDAALEASVVETGAILPLTVDDKGGIIDGLRLWHIYQKHGTKDCWVTVLTDLTREQKLHLAVTLNSNRRHLSTAHKKELVRRLLRKNPKLSGRYLAKLVGLTNKTAQRVKDDMVSCEEIPHMEEIEGRRDGKVYRAKGACAPVREFTQTGNTLGEVKEVPSVVTPKKVRSLRVKERREQAAKKGAQLGDPPGIKLLHCRFQDLLQLEPWVRGKAGALITDPPYEFAWLPHWLELADLARQVLVPGGLLVAAAPNSGLNRVIAALDTHLTYVRTIAIPFRVGGGFTSFGTLTWYGMFRPCVVYCNGDESQCRIQHKKVTDRLSMKEPQKEWHDHQQHVGDFMEFVGRFSLPGDLIVDPCAGSMTPARSLPRILGAVDSPACPRVTHTDRSPPL